jgi:biotin carboxylase
MTDTTMRAGDPPGIRPLLLLVGGGTDTYCGYLLEAAAREHDIWMIHRREPAWETPWVIGSSRADVLDPAAVVAAAQAVDKERPVAGVLCWDEALVLSAAHAVEALGLPGMSIDAVAACRDKHQTRTRLAAAGVPQARSCTASSVEEARRVADELGYPVVLKPRGLGQSRGVVRVDNARRMAAAFAEATSAGYPGVPTYPDLLVEEYLDGPEVSVDGICLDGRYQPVFVGRKELGFPPFFEEVGHLVAADDPLLTDDALLDVLAGAHRALGVGWGLTHTEVRLTADGPRIVEVNARIGGDLIPYLGQRATGIEPGVVLARLATGDRPDLEPRRRASAVIRFLYPHRDGRVVSVDLPDPAAEGGVAVEARALAAPGTVLALPPRGFVGRYAAVLAEGSDERSCRQAIAVAARGVHLTDEPLDPADPPTCPGPNRGKELA